jgi:soluble P-type ATPase
MTQSQIHLQNLLGTIGKLTTSVSANVKQLSQTTVKVYIFESVLARLSVIVDDGGDGGNLTDDSNVRKIQNP